MRERLTTLCARIKAIRKAQNLTLQSLAKKTGLTAGLLSKIENSRTIPSLPALMAISNALDTKLSDLFKDISCTDKSRWLLIRPYQQKIVKREEEHQLHYRMILETTLPAVNLQLMFVTVPSGGVSKPVSTDGDELLYILSGNFDYRIGNDLIKLAPGDMLYFDGELPHAPENRSITPGTLLALYFIKEPKP